MDLGFWDCFEGEKALVLQPKKYGISLISRQTKSVIMRLIFIIIIIIIFYYYFFFFFFFGRGEGMFFLFFLYINTCISCI